MFVRGLMSSPVGTKDVVVVVVVVDVLEVATQESEKTPLH